MVEVCSLLFQATHRPRLWEHKAITCLRSPFFLLFLPSQLLIFFGLFFVLWCLVVCHLLWIFFATGGRGTTEKSLTGDASTPGAPSGRSMPSRERKPSTAPSTRWVLRLVRVVFHPHGEVCVPAGTKQTLASAFPPFCCMKEGGQNGVRLLFNKLNNRICVLACWGCCFTFRCVSHPPPPAARLNENLNSSRGLRLF